MSAYLNGADHIDLLVSAMIEHEVTGYAHNPAKTPDWWGEQNDELRVDHATATEAGIVLITEQTASVSHLYPHDTFDELPGPNNRTRLKKYDHRPVYRPATPLDIIAAAKGYQYQACEHPGWRNSMAKALTDRLIDSCIGRLRGWDQSCDTYHDWSRDPDEPEPISLMDMSRRARAFGESVRPDRTHPAFR